MTPKSKSQKGAIATGVSATLVAAAFLAAVVIPSGHGGGVQSLLGEGTDPAYMTLQLRDCTIATNPCALIQGDTTFPVAGQIKVETFSWGATRATTDAVNHLILGNAGLNLVNLTLDSGCGLNVNEHPQLCSYSNAIYGALLGGHRIEAYLNIFASGKSGLLSIVTKVLIGTNTEAFVTEYKQSGYYNSPTPGRDTLLINTCDVVLVHVDGGMTTDSGNLCRPQVTTGATVTVTSTSTQNNTIYSTQVTTVTAVSTTTVTENSSTLVTTSVFETV